MIPRGLIIWHCREEAACHSTKAFALEVSKDSVHGGGIVQVFDAKESGIDIYKVINALKICKF